MNNVVVIDYETMSTYSDAVILSVGMVTADISKHNVFADLLDNGVEYKFDVKEQKNKFNRHVSKDTIDWWKQQSDEAKRVLMPSKNDISIEMLPTLIEKFCNAHNLTGDEIWWQRGYMDLSITEHIYKQVGFEQWKYDQPFPWKFYNAQCIRTKLQELNKIFYNTTYAKNAPKNMMSGFIPHNAMHDCAREIITYQYTLNKIEKDFLGGE